MEISSTQNSRIKQVVKLQQNARERKNLELFVVEGVRECSIALQAGFDPVEVYICDDFYEQDKHYPIDLTCISEFNIFNVNSTVYEKIAYRSGVEGIVMVFKSRYFDLDDLVIGTNPLMLVLEKVEKPGNLGAIFRTADAAGVDAVLVCDPACDPYNPNAIRSSLGCILSVPWVIAQSSNAINWLRSKKISVLASTPDASDFYSSANLKQPCAIVMGAEDTGLSDQWLKESDQLIKIPMLGRIDSLNVSVSTAILLFESRRQRMI